jgi:mono/diheme cytochrome c family protein
LASEHTPVPTRNWLRPLILGLCVSGAVFALSLAVIFRPEAPRGGTVALGDAYNGETVFQSTCADCHGAGGTGGVGPALAGSELDAAFVKSRIEQGAGTMPAGLVEGDDLDDVLAYVDQIAASS